MSSHADGGYQADSPFKKSKPNDDVEIDNTALIDVTFLLLIFFIVTSTLDSTPTAGLPVATSGLNVSAKESAVLVLSPGSGTKAIVSNLENKEFSTDEDTQITEIVDFVTRELDQGKKHVMILGDHDVRVGEVTRVQRIIGDAFENVDKTYIAVKKVD